MGCGGRLQGARLFVQGTLHDVVMDDDDDRDLRDVIGDVQALNDFLHGPGSQEIDEDDLLGSACTIDNSNSLFADAISADPTSSTKDTHNHIGEESSRLQLASSLNVLEELDASSPLSNLNGDQPFDILQKSLQEANITQQTLQEEADLAAGITSTQDFSQTPHHAASFSQVSQLPSGTSTVKGLTQQQMNVTPAPILQQVLRTPFVNNEANVQPGFFQQMGINSVAIQHVPSSNQAGGIGPIQLISSLDTQQPVMTLNHLEGSQFISKSSGQPPALNPGPLGGYNMSSLPNQQQMSLSTSGLNETGGLLLQRRVTALNGNTYYGTSNIGQVVFSRTDMPITQTSNQQQFLYSQAPKKMMATSKHQSVTSHSLASLGQLSSQVSASPFGSQTLPSSVSNDGIQQPHIPNLLSNTGIHSKTTCVGVQMNDNQLHKTAGTLPQHLGQLHSLQDKMLGQPETQKISQFEGQNVGQKRPASKQLTKESLILQQLQEEQRNVLQPDYKTPFSSLEDAVQRLLPYHVFQGNLPSQEEFQRVDNEFEDVSVQLLKRTQMMLSKYRSLLFEDAVRVNPSSEMVMIDRVFNQDEKAALIQDKRFALEDSDGYLANFCCSSTVVVKSVPETQPLTADMMPHTSLGNSSSESSPANATINQKDDSSRLINLVVSVTREVKATTNSPTSSPCAGKSYNSCRALKLTIKPETSCGTGTQSKSSKAQGRSDTDNHDGKVTIGSTSGYAQTQSTKVCEPAVEAIQICEGEESMSDVEEKHNNSCDKVTLEGIMKKAPDAIINKISDPIKLEHNEGDSQLPWHDQPQNRNAKSFQQQDLTCVQTKDAKEAQCDTSLHEHLESAINSILDLQQAQKPSDNTVIKNNSPETPHFSALAPVENYIDKCIPDHNEGIRETDSILEAAVNSILEC
ncbi:hypothetical protein chiPu_0001890 [Chiloscyllium punctatum]|uniref:GLTSCR protein conserved domain-containing protein n=1 Tax=Chiloscyllium punctatum TaxID=137246 RepID=A0A401RZB0_CHIPU|nr:hypothetical protein [Chiloscyllium punctatum]